MTSCVPAPAHQPDGDGRTGGRQPQTVARAVVTAWEVLARTDSGAFSCHNWPASATFTRTSPAA
jgi:hypothetical protein